MLGQGPGTWPMRRIEYTVPPEIDYYIPHAHSLYFQTLAELGIVGVVVGLVVLAVLGRLIWRGITDDDSTRRRFGWAALFSTAYFGAHQLLDFYPNMPAFLFAFAFPIAWLDATDPRPMFGVPESRVLRWIAVATAVVLVTASIGWVIVSERSGSLNLQVVELANQDRWDDALPLARHRWSKQIQQCRHINSRSGSQRAAGDPVRSEEAMYQAAIADDMPLSWLNSSAKLRLDRDDQAGAVDALDRALRLGSQQPAVAVNAALMWDQLGDPGARANYSRQRSRCCLPSPATPSGRGASAAAMMHDAKAIASRRDPALALSLALNSDDLEAAANLSRTLGTPQDREFADLRHPGMVRRTRKHRRALPVAQERPLDAAVVGWATRLAVRQGDTDLAERYRHWAVIIEGPLA